LPKSAMPDINIKITEDEFQTQVISLAHMLGWKIAHFRGVRTQRKDGSVFYQTPVQADGKGFPDLVMVKGKRVIYAELKSMTGKLSQEQKEWLDLLVTDKKREVYCWRPNELEQIQEILEG
jgi:hypothetical protein